MAVNTAREFLRKKVSEYAATNRRRFLGFTPRDAAVLNSTAARQIDALEKLSEKPVNRWTDDDYKKEKHALACLKSVHPFLILAAAASPVRVSALTENPIDRIYKSRNKDASPDPDDEITGEDGL